MDIYLFINQKKQRIMKAKILLFSVALAATVFTSCSNEDIPLEADYQNDVISTTVENDDFLKLKEHIIEYGTLRAEQNAVALSGNVVSDNSQTRGFWGKVWGFLKSLYKADGKGAKGKKSFEDKITDAVSASVDFVINVVCGDVKYDENVKEFKIPQKALRIEADSSNFCPINPASVALNEDVIFSHAASGKEVMVTQADSAGYYHNATIVDVFETIPSLDVLADMSAEDRLTVINASVERIFNLEEGSLQNDTVRNTEILCREEKSESVLENCEENYEFSQVMSVIETYLESMYSAEGMDGDWVEYSKGVMAIIDDSDLDDDSKEQMRTVFTIVFGSSQLWNKENLEELLNE